MTEQRLPPAARSASWRPEKSRARARPILVVLLVALIVANALNISADLVAVGSGMNLLHAGPTWVWALVAGVLITVLVIVGAFVQIARVFKLICLALFSYFAVMFSVHVNWGQVGLRTVVPHLEVSNKDYLALLVAVLGTTISPCLFFWQSAHRLEELRTEPEGGDRAVPLTQRTASDAKYKSRTSRGDVFTGMGFSNAAESGERSRPQCGRCGRCTARRAALCPAWIWRLR